MALNFVQSQAFTLAGAGNAIGATTLVVQDFNDLDGVALTMADFGSVGYGTCEPNSSNEEQISWTGITVNGDGTSTLTGVSTVLTYTPYTKTSGLANQHAGGTKFVVSNTAGFYNEIAVKQNNETVTGAWQFPNNGSTPTLGASYVAPTLSNQIASKGYVDSVAIAGAPDASTTVKGIVEIATGAELAAGTGTGGTGAVLVPAGSSFTNTSSGAGDVNKVAVLDASGQLATGFIKDASTTVAGKVELATGAETAAGTATGGAGPLVPANSSFTATSAGAADANKVPVLTTGGVLASGFMYPTGTSGEAFSAGAALYVKASDGKLYMADADAASVETTYSFVGIAIDAAGAADVTVRYAAPGQIATLSSSTAGAPYFISNTAGSVATAPGTRFARIGIGLPGNKVMVIMPKYVVSGSFTYVNTDPSPLATQTTGFYPALVQFRSTASGSNACISIGDNFSQASVTPGTAFAPNMTSNAWYLNLNGSGTLATGGTIGTRTATGFTPTHSTVGNPGTVTVQWTAESL